MMIEEGKKRGIISRLQLVHLSTIQDYGNFGSHDQGGEEDDLSYHEILPCLQATESLMRWWDPSFNPDEFAVSETTEADEEIEQPAIEGRPKSVRVQMRKMAEEQGVLSGGEITLKEIVGWFAEHYPNYKKSTIEAHVAMMTTNGEARLHHELRDDGTDELFFRVSPGTYRAYVKDDDSEPITEVEQYSGWQEKLAVVNCAGSLAQVVESGIYLSPHLGGNYKMQRANYFGLYKNKTVSSVASVIAKITFRRPKSKGHIWWCIDDDIDRNELRVRVREHATQNWDGAHPVQAFVLGAMVDTDFKKDTKGGFISNNKIFDISELRHGTAENLAEALKEKVWSDF
jgi:hypothetical protein